jgi:capsular exopolysaccharide synthesis family protein
MAPPPGLSSGPDVFTLLKALRRRWLLALGLGSLVAAAAGVAAWFLLAGKYTAFALLHIASTQPRIVFRVADAPEGRYDFLTYQRTQAARLKSRFVLNAALKRDEVKNLRVLSEQADPLAWLESEIKVEYNEGSEILTVSLSGAEPDEMVALVNAVTQAYLKEIIDVERKQRSERVEQLEDVHVKSKEKLRAKREALRKRVEDLGTSDSQALSQKQVILMTTFGEVKKQHAQVRFELLRAQGRLTALQAQAKTVPEPDVHDSVLNEALEADLTARQYLTRLAHLKGKITHYEITAVQKDETSLVLARKQFQAMERNLAARRAELLADLKERLRQKARAEYTANLVKLQDEIVSLTEQEKTLGADVHRLAQEFEKIGHSSTEVEMLRAEIKQEENFTEHVGRELDALQVELRSPPRVSLYQEAALQKQENKRQILATVLAPVAALAGVGFGVAWLEFRRRRIQSTDEVVTGLGMRVVGTVPALPDHTRRLVATNDNMDLYDHSLVEAIDAIRTLLLREATVQATRVVMVTSAVGGEGKTTLATHLASSLARAGRRTLLIDCDLRRPAAHQLFELPLQPGFSEILLEEIEIEDAVLATPVDNLWMIPAGQWDRDVIQALAQDSLKDTFARLKDQYDFVVVDSHPVLPATDSLLIGQHVDAVLLSLLRDVSQMPRVYAACQRLATLDIRVFGAVVNGMRPDDVYGHGYQYSVQAA